MSGGSFSLRLHDGFFKKKSDLQVKCSDEHFRIKCLSRQKPFRTCWMNSRPHDKLGAEPGMFCRTNFGLRYAF
jgi:hypothetical protein